MSAEHPLQRENLSDAAAAAVRALIVDGGLAAGERLNEVRLAERLGVSRTPLREGLNRLVAEGAVESRPRLGYFVKPLTLAEFEQVYDIRPLLDPEALRLAGLPTPAQLERLDKLNRKLVRTREAAATIAVDDEWHLALLENCPNRVLVGLIEAMMLRTRRYELALMRDSKGVARAGDDHDRILAALRAHDLENACAALRVNMQSGKGAIVAWLKTRDAENKVGKR